MAKFDSFYEALNKARKKAGLESTEELAKKAAPKPQDTTLKDIGKIFQNLWSGTKNSIRGMKITSADSDVQLSNFAYKDQLSALNDAAKSPWAKTWNRDNLNVWSGMHGGIYQARRDKESTAKNNLYALSKRIEEEQKRLQELNKDSSPLVKVISDMAYSAGNMAPALPFGPGGMILQGASNYGANLADELNAGTDIEEARKRAGTRATVETGIEYLSGGLAGTAAKSGLMKPVTKAIDNVVTNNLGRKTLTRLAASAGEGAEEALTTAIMPYIDRTYLGVDTPNATWGDLGKAFGLGSTASLAMGTGQDAVNALRNRRAVNNISDKTSLSNEEVRNTIDNLSEAEPYQVARQLKKQGVGETVTNPKQGNNLLMEAIYGGDIPQQKINGLPDLETQIQENRANIANQKPIKIRGERFKMGTGTLKADVEQLFREHGNMAHNDMLGDVELNTKGVKDSIGHGMSKEKAALYEAVPALIQNGKIVDYVENHKGRGYNSAILEAPVTITKGDAKGDYIAEVVVHRIAGDKRQRYYLHDVTIKKIKDGIYNKQTRQGGTVEQPRSLPDEQVNPSSIDYNIQQDEKYVNSVPQNNDRSIDQLLVERLQLPMASNDDTSSIYNMLQDGNYVNDGNTGEDILFAETDNGKGTRQTAKRILGGESFVTNTTTDSDTRDLYREVIEANKNYTKKSFAKTEERAAKILEERGIDGAQAYLYKEAGRKGGLSVDDFTLAIETLRALEEQGGQNEAWVSMYKTIAENVHNAGQMLSFSKLLYKDGGSAAAMKLMNEVRQINAERGIDIQVDEAKFSELAQLKPGEEARAKELLTDLYAEIGQQVPSTWREKLNAWRYTAMLANVKTHVRNIAGNSGMWAMAKASNWIDGALQSVLIKNKNERTNSFGAYFNSDYKAAYKYAGKLFDEHQSYIKNGTRYENAHNQIMENMTVFKTKILEKLRKANSGAMEFEDDFFIGPAFKKYFAQEAVSRGYSIEDIKRSPALMDQIMEHAAIQAQKDYFHDSSKFAASVTKTVKGLEKSNNILARVLGHAIEGTIPFAKTPANVIKRAVDYSPAGFLKTFGTWMKIKGTPFAKAKIINGISENLTGTALLFAGKALSDAGILRVGADDDQEEYYQQGQGRQRYSLEVGDTSISLDWLAPASIPIFMGAALNETEGINSADDALKVAEQILGPAMEMSMVSSVDDLLTAVKKEETNLSSIISGLIYTPLESYILQYFPTIGSQMNQVIDPTRRTTSDTNTDSEVLSRLEKTGRKALNKLPGANLLLENMGLKDVANAPYVNAWGEKQVNDGNVLERVFNSFINPAYVNEIKSDEVDREIERLYNSNVEDSKYIIPTTSFGTVTNGGNEYKMTTTEVTNHRQTRGQMSKRILRSLINNSAYRSASDEDKIKMIKDVYKYAEYRADTKMLEGRGKTYNINESDWRKKVDYLDAAGISPTTYFLAHNARSNATGQYTLNQWGERESIEGSVKKAQVNAINGYGMTAAQKLLFLYLETPSYSYGREYSGMSNDQARKVVANYVTGLNIPYEEKVKILKRAGYHIKNGYAYWD